MHKTDTAHGEVGVGRKDLNRNHAGNVIQQRDINVQKISKRFDFALPLSPICSTCNLHLASPVAPEDVTGVEFPKGNRAAAFNRGATRNLHLHNRNLTILRNFNNFYRINIERGMMTRKLIAIIEREDDGFVALCPEIDVASQGRTVGEARKNLQEALELFFETASPEEIKDRLQFE
ncbi:MAG: type II toxin-antitoxin system HicB family antitoxin [Desulfobacterales bacterium]